MNLALKRYLQIMEMKNPFTGRWSCCLPFRGQNQEHIPCYPSLYRETPRPLTDSEIFTWKMRFMLFCDMLDTYPIVDKFFKRHNFKIDYEGLAQHYGLLTSVLDLTSNIDIALFLLHVGMIKRRLL